MKPLKAKAQIRENEVKSLANMALSFVEKVKRKEDEMILVKETEQAQ